MKTLMMVGAVIIGMFYVIMFIHIIRNMRGEKTMTQECRQKIMTLIIFGWLIVLQWMICNTRAVHDRDQTANDNRFRVVADEIFQRTTGSSAQQYDSFYDEKEPEAFVVVMRVLQDMGFTVR